MMLTQNLYNKKKKRREKTDATLVKHIAAATATKHWFIAAKKKHEKNLISIKKQL